VTPPLALSVALVTRNRSGSLDRCLQSWRNQQVQPDEIVVSDDSDDNEAVETAAVAERYGCVYTQGPRRGLYANRNHASLLCHGTHILSADDDHTHPADYVDVARDLVGADPRRVWIFTELHPEDPAAPLVCPPELHRSGHGCPPHDPSRCAAIADGSSVFPREIFDSGLRYDETYPFGGMWYLWGKLLARRGWHITFSDRTFVWHHERANGIVPDTGRQWNRELLRQMLLATAYAQFVDALWLERSFVRFGWACLYTARRVLYPDSIIGYKVSTTIPVAGTARAIRQAWRAQSRYLATS
jgi:glycosyltransferase involved in cell wall biosynthesis